MSDSQKTYIEKYSGGYGLSVSDGHVIRFYERILKYKLNKTSGNMLDFGCGNGVHARYFQSKGFTPFGVDIVPTLVNSWQDLSATGGGICIIEPNASLKGLFGVKFDLVFANQSLYYLPQKALRQNIDELFELSNEGAIIFATMMSEKNYYFKFAGAENEEGLREVRLKGRLNETSFIHFTKEAKELEALFKPFETLYLGEYEPFYLYDFEGSAQHFIYIGVKR